MKKLLLAGTATLALTGAASAEDVKMGIILGFTGPLESITPNMASGAELAVNEVNEAGTLLEGSKVTVVRADSTCVDAAAATAAAERLVTSDKVQGIMGADCSGVTGAVLQNVARPNGVVMISPSATSPALSEAEDDGLFFRTAPSDARQGEVIAEILKERDIGSVAITYTNNDYGKGLADSIQQAFEKAGGKVTISAAHEDGKADYSAEVAALAAAGGDMLVVAGYVDQGGKGVIQAALDTGAFETFFLPDGMYGDALVEAIGSPLDGSFGTVPGTDSEGATKILDMAKEAGFDGTSSYVGESYDAASLILLAMQAAGSAAPADYKSKIEEVANAPGEKIYPGDLAKAIELLKAGTDIDYVGATNVELIGPGESAGSFREYTVKDGKFETDRFR
ncbi:ABC transporter substrate-binding protein [Rhodobacter sphaeroides]|jgi:branched-chain amino acid transport system substrate-binding protein|uniref:Amino acid/amide ABC transporter substrate-binding protein, HAAT family n=1 Tax=Cereibacter sphaeroides (strain ATCC 17023 / DSM 158 / JCM 6121 / CCUG 31486 / LMG 2827 / NBRC 12203 / NCIMB 8253 / ATH 2.4.1.) TaxID=272943 RepID=Q3J2A0_CERS4|nr:ABC transporter substrate-binding protein [Cereibacter sphaeroides]ABA79084.1 amino acid/amide ABC transporter substrate-binding protein, HAAT family [Cereibacter sphaeroides 2.4.1]AMJ47403.1 branched-chain amino acid ABC transporter substrate-binding protein [Cereibacter sphaeroides]ANS34116.1 branched-chain amino acid ABC transporter substrate-binding protein [Cereibacter sphaeroides]ATN63160.1 branched-chain amino acid ABC transporter substrate-binding protein [Cereibacter sphaeroides]AX